MYSKSKNEIFFQRLKAVAVAQQNLIEEIQRLQDWRDKEISPNGSDDKEFTDTIHASIDEAKSLMDYLIDLKRLHHGEAVEIKPRSDTLIPFLSDKSVLTR